MSRYPLLSLFITGCMYPTLAPHIGEGTTVLKPKQVGVTVTGGGGGGRYTIGNVNTTSLGGGAEARVRVGLSGNQELGGSVVAGIGSKVTGEPPVGAGVAVSYKIAPLSWLALVADVGAIDRVISSTAIFGGSLGVIVAPYTASGGTQLYTGAKGSVSIPILQGASGSAFLVAVPIGLDWHATSRFRTFVEGGFLLGHGEVVAGGTTTATDGYGGYGAVGVGYAFR